MATIREIAEKANVSIATVSKVLNRKGGISQETVNNVMKVARELNYRPNFTARSLKNGQSRTIGVITEDLTVFNTPEIVDGIDAYCENNGYHYILGNLRFNKRFGNHPDPDECAKLVHSHVDTMLSKQVNGIIYIGYHSRAISPVYNYNEIPFVYTYCYSTDPNIPCVLYDDQKAAYEATQLLIDRGHCDIGVIAGPADSIHSANRILGYQEALYANKIPFNPKYVIYGDWERQNGYELSEELIKSRVTAIFAHNDLMAAGVIDYCNEHKIQVGKDLALIGFDNREIATASRPEISTVSLPLFDMGQTATQVLLNILAGKHIQRGQKVMLACTIIERESTMPASDPCKYR
jgi:DNA-binding LacI/PurR family transcriptional regulator